MLEQDRTAVPARQERHWLAGIAVSLIAHSILTAVVVLRLLVHLPPPPPPPRPAVGEDRVVARLVLPPPAVLRPRAAPVPPPPPALPAGHAPPPPAPRAKDKISIGPPSLARAKEIWLRKDEDIPKEAQGNGALGPQEKALPGPAATAAPTAEPTAAAVARVGRGDRPLAPADAGGPSITRSLQRLEETLHQQGGAGLGLGPTGPKSVDGLEYDPEGADFTDWINHLKRELYRNWIVPQAAMMGFRGHVTVGFAVARDGHLVEGEILSPSGTISLDHAAKNAVLGSRMLPLPSDYAPNVFRIRVTFYYNEGPRSS